MIAASPTTSTLSPTPPMGWNSWDCFGTSVTEAEVLANAEFMATRLKSHGWTTVVVDIQWYEPTARAGGYNDHAPLALDGFGRPVPAPNRFPSSADGSGFTQLAGRVHDLGLQFGVHIMRGIPRLAVERNLPVLGTSFTARDVADTDSICVWNTDNYGLRHDHPGAAAYYDSLAQLFAEWGVDFVKADDMLGPYHRREIEAMSGALRRTGRPIQFSLSPGRVLSTAHIEHLRSHADMWRVADDLWDRWEDVSLQFERLARWAPFTGPGSWPDADMLPLGHIGIRAERGEDRSSLLTVSEQQTLMTLWCMARSPLMMGGDLPTSDHATIDLLTNDDVLAVLQSTTHNRQVIRDENLVVWAADATDRTARYAALFNLGDTDSVVALPAASAGLEPGHKWTDVWTGEAVVGADGVEDDVITATLAPHGCLLLRAE